MLYEEFRLKVDTDRTLEDEFIEPSETDVSQLAEERLHDAPRNSVSSR